MGKLTKKEQARKLAIINQLSELSRNGWKNAKWYDYQPLERELRALESLERSDVPMLSKLFPPIF